MLHVPTTRGDRLFISLLAARLHCISPGSDLVGADTIATLPFGDGLEVSSLWLASTDLARNGRSGLSLGLRVDMPSLAKACGGAG